MTDANTQGNGTANPNAAAPDKEFVIQKVYIKDVSFETPNSPAIFTQKWEPNVNLELSTSGRALAEGVHEVVLSLTVTAKIGDKTAYLVEAQQAGVFTIRGFSEQELAPMLGSFCPNVLFPFAREAVAELVAKGGFPQLILAPVNFDALFAQHMQRAQQQQAKKPEESGAMH
jgi:preprotein translocase subunit SecB